MRQEAANPNYEAADLDSGAGSGSGDGSSIGNDRGGSALGATVQRVGHTIRASPRLFRGWDTRPEAERGRGWDRDAEAERGRG